MASRATVARAVTVVVLRATVVILAPALLMAQVAIAAEAMNRLNVRMTRMATDPAKALQVVVRLHLALLAQLRVSPARPASPACPGHLDQTVHFRMVRLVYPVARLVVEHCRQEADQANSLPVV